MKITYPSSSSDTVHTVTVHAGGNITCTCRGFRTPNGCWHVKDATEKLTTGQPVVEPDAPVLVEKVESQGFIKPQLACALKEGKELEDYALPSWVLEEKIDGHRMILLVTEFGVTAYSRTGKARRLPDHIVKQARLLAPGTYDGELYIPGGTSTDVTTVLLQHKLKLALFDILRVGTISCMQAPGHDRRRLLEAAHQLVENDSVHVTPQFPVTKAGLTAIWNRGGEGAIIKRTATTYHPGKRVADWVKFKKEGAAEVTVTGFLPGRLGPHSVITGIDQHGIEVQVKTLNDQWREDLAVNAVTYIGQRLVISYQEKTRDGRYRHPMADHWV